MENDGCYWYPFRPSFRWPVRLLGMLFLLAALAEWVSNEPWPWRWQALFAALAFLIWSFRAPKRRPHPFSSPFGKVLSRILIILLLCAGLIHFTYFFVLH